MLCKWHYVIFSVYTFSFVVCNKGFGWSEFCYRMFIERCVCVTSIEVWVRVQWCVMSKSVYIDHYIWISFWGWWYMAFCNELDSVVKLKILSSKLLFLSNLFFWLVRSFCIWQVRQSLKGTSIHIVAFGNWKVCVKLCKVFFLIQIVHSNLRNKIYEIVKQ